MAENGNGKTWWLAVIQQVAFPIVACCAVTWFAYQTIQWERDQLLPALQSNTEVLREVEQVLRAKNNNPH